VTVHSLWSGLGPFPTWAAAVSGMRSAPVTWTSVSEVAAREVGRRVPAYAQVHVLPDAVDVSPRDRTPAPGGCVRLVSTMRIAARKRPLDLLRIFERVQQAVRVPVSLTIVGDGQQRPRLERLVATRGLTDHVRITGRVEPTEVLELLSTSDVYVAPAVLESFGLAALEARAVGLPVVGRLGTGLTDFIEDEVEGLLCVGRWVCSCATPSGATGSPSTTARWRRR
jgi:glycosyltransferase involved in cell wall biosynthesis